MKAITAEKKRKIIDIDATTFHSLSVAAARAGVSLKKFIENLLDNAAESYNDAAVYSYLLESDPDGTELLSQDEKTEFENWLGL